MMINLEFDLPKYDISNMKRKDFIPSFYINDQIMNWPPMGNTDE